MTIWSIIQINMPFIKGHIKYSFKGDFKKDNIPWNIGTSVWIECKCVVCREDFMIREYQLKRGRGKYCSRSCQTKTTIAGWNEGQTETKLCLQCNKPFEIRPCEEYRKFCSRRCVGLAKPKTPNWGKYRGISMRSGYEIGYAKYLDKNKIAWEYEPKTFDLGYSSYTPDFYLPEKQVYVEIKGWMRKEALLKIKEFIKQNPDIKYLLLGEKDLKEMEIL